MCRTPTTRADVRPAASRAGSQASRWQTCRHSGFPQNVVPRGLERLARKVPPRILPRLLLAGRTLPVRALWHPPPQLRGAAAAPLVLGFSVPWRGFFFNRGSVAQNALSLPGDSISKKSGGATQRGARARARQNIDQEKGLVKSGIAVPAFTVLIVRDLGK